jgi:hypothetical protein
MPVTVTKAQWEAGIARSGIPGRFAWSSHLSALADALGQYAADAASSEPAAFRNVGAKFKAWDEGDHPGEHARLKKTPEYTQLKRDLGGSDGATGTRAILLVVWGCPHDSAWHKLTHRERSRQLDTVIAGAHNRLSRIPLASRSEGLVQVLLVAPEYQYTAPAKKRTPMEEWMKVEVEAGLRLRSEANPTFLLVAGSSHYMKDEIRPKGAAGHKVNPATGLRSIPTGDATRRLRAQQHLQDAQDKHVEMGLDYLNTQGAFGTDPNTGHVNVRVPALDSLAPVLQDPASTPRIVRNVAYMFLAGRRMATYDKQSDHSEALNNSPDAMMFIPGTAKHCPVIGGRRYGLEICYDHAIGVLKMRNPGDLQFHLVMSDSVTTVPGHMAMSPGGYFVHASTDSAETCVYYSPPNGGGPGMIAPQESDAFGSGSVEYYIVPEPPPTSFLG